MSQDDLKLTMRENFGRIEEPRKTAKSGFDKWWEEDGKFLDPDTSDVSWFDKRKALAQLAFEAGIDCGMARSRNYTANEESMPDAVTFANGRKVTIADNKSPGVHHGVYLEVE